MRIGTLLAPGNSPARTVAGVAEAAARGVDSVWTNQHPGGWDPLAVLAASATTPTELGTAIVPTYPRHPVVMATEALTVQALTGGRLTLGIGPSHEWYVSAQLGIPYTSPAAHSREYLEILRALLRGDHVQYTGRFFSVDTRLEVAVDPPPILLSALGPRMLRTARDLADGTIAVWVRPNTVAEHLAPALGDGARIAVISLVALTTDPDGLRESVARDFAAVAEMPAYRAVLDRGGLSGPADTIVAGTDEQVLRELGRFRDAGVTDLIVSPLGSPAEQQRVLDVALELRRSERDRTRADAP